MALMLVPSRRSSGSARATISCFWLGVRVTGPMVVSPMPRLDRSWLGVKVGSSQTISIS